MAFATFGKSTGLSPLAPGAMPKFAAVYAGYWIAMNFLRPARIAVAVTISPFFRTAHGIRTEKIQPAETSCIFLCRLPRQYSGHAHVPHLRSRSHFEHHWNPPVSDLTPLATSFGAGFAASPRRSTIRLSWRRLVPSQRRPCRETAPHAAAMACQYGFPKRLSKTFPESFCRLEPRGSSSRPTSEPDLERTSPALPAVVSPKPCGRNSLRARRAAQSAEGNESDFAPGPLARRRNALIPQPTARRCAHPTDTPRTECFQCSAAGAAAPGQVRRRQVSPARRPARRLGPLGCAHPPAVARAPALLG
eukprot:CAMPEP_0172171320 /NCGR_PEP_ID=MMETSP1050-20130122/11824_1 /TAXON_ID=233186 /ORGANISM="Cryptomonas curvata, Strain CCAP979/52" /LENGTH=304 /DNA_ID=CAMNT_0012842733 /DNA_START=245 /DNA_END=1156 /DNA_ORIENTATION=-